MGYAGQVSFGQNAFAAIGGYGSAVLTTTYGWEPLAACGGLAFSARSLARWSSAIRRCGCAATISAMATLAIGLITYEIAVQWRVGDARLHGHSGIPPLGIGRFERDVGSQQLLVLLIALAARRARCCRHPPFAVRPRASSRSPAARTRPRALGIDVARYKLVAFLISAFYASVAGLAVRACRRLRQPGGVRPAHGRAGASPCSMSAASARSRVRRSARSSSRCCRRPCGASANIRTSPTARVLILILIYAPRRARLALAQSGGASARRRRMSLLQLDKRYASASAGLLRSTRCRFDVAAGRRHARSSGRTAPARRRCSTSSPASAAPTAGA